jgi:hypothetical protein
VLLIRCQRKTCNIGGRRLDIVTFRSEVSGLYLEYLGAFVVDVINLEFILEGDKQIALVELDGLQGVKLYTFDVCLHLIVVLSHNFDGVVGE